MGERIASQSDLDPVADLDARSADRHGHSSSRTDTSDSPAENQHQPVYCPDGGTSGTGGAEDRPDIPTPPPTLSDEHLSLINEQPTSRLDTWAVCCYQLAATGTHDQRAELIDPPAAIPDPYLDRIRYMHTRELRGMAAHSLALLGDGVAGFTFDPTTSDRSQYEYRGRLYEWVERRYRGKRVEKGVPAHATLTIKTISSGGSGNNDPQDYLYWQFRSDGSTRTQYVCSVGASPFDGHLDRAFHD